MWIACDDGPVLAVLARRWAHLLLGGALLMPYFLLAEAVASTVTGRDATPSLPTQLVLFALTLPAVGVTALAGPVRLLMGVAARELLGAAVAAAPARSVDDRLRTGAWSVVHVAFGGVVSALSLTLPPVIGLLFALPWVRWRSMPTGWAAAWGPFAGMALLAALVAVVFGCGALLARIAAGLLGPSATDRLVGLRRQVRENAVRARLARDLHDSLGHALSIISVQAGAGGRRLDDDPAFARAAFAAIRDAAYTASEELDRAIGLLGACDPPDSREPDLADLDGLVGAVRDAGVEVDYAAAGVGAVPVEVSRQLYRVVQEGLTNAVRHGGRAPVRVRVRGGAGEVRVEVVNRLDGVPGRAGRGLRGMAERVAGLGGSVEAGPGAGGWRVDARVPVEGP